jgi:hypothetical protein
MHKKVFTNKRVLIATGIAALLFLFMLVYSPGKNIIGSPETGVYSYIKEIERNPTSFSVVITDSNPGIADDFSKKFGIDKIKFDYDQELSNGLIIVGINNRLAKELMGDYYLNGGEALIRLYPTNGGYVLVVAGESERDTIEGLDILKNYRVYQKQLGEMGVVLSNGKLIIA